MKRILITGAAGFIGFHLSLKLLEQEWEVAGVDNLNDYYDVNLKQDRLKQLQQNPNFTFEKIDISDTAAVQSLFSKNKFDAVVNMAAQAGVRYSLQHPHLYMQSNITGFLNILEGCRHGSVGHLVFASSSSVYGANTKIPFSVHDNVDHPVSLYAATKKSNELMAHAYSSLYGIPVTGLRFFTVYGPWGRPDMAYFLFTKALFEGREINLYNHGKMERDFTYIDDIIEGVVRIVNRRPAPAENWNGDQPDPAGSYAPYKIYNIGNSQPVDLLRFIGVLEKCTGKKPVIRYLPMQPGEVPVTYANIDELTRDTGFRPAISIEKGIEKFVEWYRDYYAVPLRGGQRQ